MIEQSPVRDVVDARPTAGLVIPDRSTVIPVGHGSAAIRVERLVGPHADWDRYVQRHAQGTIFHTLGWREAVRAAFPHRDHYLVARRGSEVAGVLPLFCVNSRLIGRMLISVPYGVGGGILADDAAVADALLTAARAQAEGDGCCAIDFRSVVAASPRLSLYGDYVTFARELPDHEGDVLTWLPRKARAAARQARDRHGLTITHGDHQLVEVWRLYTRSMRRLGSINYPLAFFRGLIEHTPGNHWVSVVRRQGRAVAGLLTLLYGDRVLPYFVGMSDDAQRVHAANFLYFRIMQRAVSDGFRVFDFGRSRRGNTGSFDFKRFHGFEPRALAYQMDLMPGAVAPRVSPADARYRLIRCLWRRLPLCVTRAAGQVLSRHLPG